MSWKRFIKNENLRVGGHLDETLEQHQNSKRIIWKPSAFHRRDALQAPATQCSTVERKGADAQKRLTTLMRYQAWREHRHWSRHAARNNPTAQCTFKVLLVLGILQFTMFITLRCALHRCLSRDICRWKLLIMMLQKHRSRTRSRNQGELKSQRQQEARGWPLEVPLALPPLTNCMRKATTLEKQHRLTQKSHR